MYQEYDTSVNAARSDTLVHKIAVSTASCTPHVCSFIRSIARACFCILPHLRRVEQCILAAQAATEYILAVQAAAKYE